jgi:hypothetical protein
VELQNRPGPQSSAYVKNDKSELREMAKLKLKIDKINEGKFINLGVI